MPQKPDARHLDLWIAILLFLATLAVYVHVLGFGFVNFDDPDYVSANPHVRQGLTGAAVVWAFTSAEAANWFPLTRLSHILDWQLFGSRSGLHHLTSVLFHALAAVLLFVFLKRATRARWPSAFVAFLFALHPLHVESVAWVAERKDVLCAFFWFLALWGYVRYAERPSRGRYLLVVAAFCLGLMSKPMIVTLPFLLLLLDVWPLRRFERWKAVREKIPLFALAAAGAAITFLTQRSSGAVEAFSVHPLGLRIENALVSYVAYVAKMFWPTRLAVFYPYPRVVPAWEAALAALAIASVSVLVVRSFRARPYLAVGWFWFLGTLLPVIGLVQVGAQARADRYTYVPLVGLSIMLAWGAADALRHWPHMKPAVAVLAAASCSCLALATLAQTGYWRNSEQLFEHALAVTERNDVAEHNLGSALLDSPERLPDAIAHLQAALRINPASAKTRTDLASALSRTPGRLPEAVAEYEEALRTNPDSPIPHNNLGNTLSKMPGRLPDAIREYRAALRIAPDYAEAHNNLGSALAQIPGGLPEAIREFETALRIAPDYAAAHDNFGSALAQTPRGLPAAIREFQTALRLQPSYARAHVDLGNALAETPGGLPQAIEEYEAALRIDPNSAEAHNGLGSALSRTPGRSAEAIPEYEAALRIEPDSAEAHYNLGLALSHTADRSPAAIAQFEAALKIRPDYAEAHNNLGVALSQVPGGLPEAIAHFEAAARIRPDYADAHYNLGVALSNVPGRLTEAIAQLEKALRIRPDAEVRGALERLRASRAP